MFCYDGDFGRGVEVEEFRSDCETGYAAAEDDDGWRLLLGHSEVVVYWTFCMRRIREKGK